MNRFEMLRWIHEVVGEFKDPQLSNTPTPHGWQWSNGLFRSTSPDYPSIYRGDYCAYVDSLKIPEVKK